MVLPPALTARTFRFERVVCDLCGSDFSRPVMQKRGRICPEPFSIVRCRRCGLVYVNPRIVESEFDELYDEAYYRGDGFDATIDYRRDYREDPSLRKDVDRIVDTLREGFGPIAGRRVLDAGCGTGALLHALTLAGARAEGLDSSPEARRRCRAAGLAIVAGDIFDAGLEAQAYDAVTAVEVIEHVPSPTKFLQRIRELLKPGGIFYYTTGNWNLVRRIPGTPYVMPEGHIYYFTPSTMRRYLAKTGFEVARGVVNRAWVACRLMPDGVLNRVPRRLVLAASSVCADLGQFPIARRAGKA